MRCLLKTIKISILPPEALQKITYFWFSWFILFNLTKTKKYIKKDKSKNEMNMKRKNKCE